MSLLMAEKQILDKRSLTLKQGEKITVRRQQCLGCNRVLAFQVGSNLDEQSKAEYYVIKDCLWVQNEPLLLYKQEKWFGNYVICPVCGRTGRLPMDKPYNWEMIEKSNKERKDALRSN